MNAEETKEVATTLLEKLSTQELLLFMRVLKRNPNGLYAELVIEKQKTP